MIRCNHCGKLVPADISNCQHCGMPLSSTGAGGANPKMSAQDQPELPAWLESLRANERSDVPAGAQPGFSVADLIDEGALPSWMRPESADLAESGNSGKYPAWRPASMSAPNTDSDVPPKGFSASSLIDPTALPAWVRTNQELSQAPGEVSMPETQRSFSVASLIQADALPDWLKQSQEAQQPAGNNTQNQAWGGNAQTPFTAAPAQGQRDISASSLLDVNALPGWLREGEKTQNQSGYPQANAQNLPPAQAGQYANGNGNLAAASLIDMNALPAWLRAPEGQPQGGGAQPVPGGYGMPHRVESVRVPSRPRGDMGAYDRSEVAANVFSSLLGVPTPYFPAQPSSDAPGSQQGFQSLPPQPGYAAPGAPPVQGYMQGGYPAGQPGGYQAPYQGGGGDYSMSSPPGMSQPQTRSPASSQGTSPNQAGARRDKKGFLETIREWFRR